MSAPIRNPGVERAALFRHQAEDGTVLVHHVVRGHPSDRIPQPVDRVARASHAGIVQDQHVYRDTGGAIVLIGAEQFTDAEQAHNPRSRLILSQAALICATFSLARAMNSPGTPRAARLSGWFSRISRFHVERMVSSLA